MPETQQSTEASALRIGSTLRIPQQASGSRFQSSSPNCVACSSIEMLW